MWPHIYIIYKIYILLYIYYHISYSSGKEEEEEEEEEVKENSFLVRFRVLFTIYNLPSVVDLDRESNCTDTA